MELTTAFVERVTYARGIICKYREYHRGEEIQSK